jgi:mono/diheme cytochrome c family protein
VLTRHLNWFVCILAAQALATTASAQTPAEQGRVLFEQLCTACHSVGGGDRVGPDLAGVTQRREVAWLKRMIREPDALIAEGDPVVTALSSATAASSCPNSG